MSKTNKDEQDARRGIPLASIRVFVEVVRLLSFSRAAERLGMTQSGVSHHVSVLEKYLGRRLFSRNGSSVAMTETGRQYFDSVQEAFSTIELSTRQLAQHTDDGRLIVRTSLPSFATAALIPLLPDFAGEAKVQVDLITSLAPPAGGDVFDVMLTRDLDVGDDAHWQIAVETLVCVGAPAPHEKYCGKPVSERPFVTARSRPDTLSAWAAAQMIEASAIRVSASFEHYFLAIPAAVAGMGYLIAPKLLVVDALRLGTLVEAEFAPVRTDVCYKAWVNPRSAHLETANTFCRWLKAALRSETPERGAP